VHKMRKVFHAKSLSMDFCLECHRSPEEHLRPLEEVYNLDYKVLEYLADNKELAEKIDLKDGDSEAVAQKKLGLLLKKNWSVHPKESCFTCHR
ncbi:MAG: cytochrome C, partial [Akkermansiaceae bacterium]